MKANTLHSSGSFLKTVVTFLFINKLAREIIVVNNISVPATILENLDDVLTFSFGIIFDLNKKKNAMKQTIIAMYEIL